MVVWVGREGLGIVFQVSNTSFIVSLLSAAFILLIVNEVRLYI
jgi:hypothetical protein